MRRTGSIGDSLNIGHEITLSGINFDGEGDIIRNRIMKKRKRAKLPFSLVLIPSLALPILALNISPNAFNFQKIIYASTALAMPDCIPAVISELYNKSDISVFHIFGSPNSDENVIFQKIGSAEKSNEQENSDIFDIMMTPQDIYDSMNIVKNEYINGKYTDDGTVKEMTYTDEQSNCSDGNVFVRNATETKDIDVSKILKSGCKLPNITDNEPVVLIYHTHSTETYAMIDNGKFSSDYPSRSNNKNINMIRIGDEIVKALESQGISVIHDRDIHDTVYTGAYNVSRAAVEEYLNEYPSIFITLDIHRDAVYIGDKTRVKPTVTVSGKKAAQIMIIAGAQDGSVEDFPMWEKNLGFGINLQKAVNDKYENLMKPLYFCCRKYNMDVTPYSLLIEIGTDVNTLEEAAYSARLFGDALGDFIRKNI